tara:strand:- start:3593 stop:4486 length:894 start_codon:yes stop_codon:yes gene_type:complete
MSNYIVNGQWTGPVVDQHIHLDRSNQYLTAVDEFVRVGGTGLMLVHKPQFNSLPVDISGYKEAYNETLLMAEEVRKRYSIPVGVVLGPHPVAWENQIDKLGIKRATELHLESVSLAIEHIDSGEAHCLGEVGRPHYPISSERWSEANLLLREIMSMAASARTSVQLHVEDAGEQTYSELAKIADSSGIDRKSVVRHFAPADVSSQFTNGLSCTVSVGSGSVDRLLATYKSSNSRWGMETDFLDDPKRPGAVLGPKTIPKRTNQLCSALIETEESDHVEELLLSIHSKWPSELYGIDF